MPSGVIADLPHRCGVAYSICPVWRPQSAPGVDTGCVQRRWLLMGVPQVFLLMSRTVGAARPPGHPPPAEQRAPPPLGRMRRRDAVQGPLSGAWPSATGPGGARPHTRTAAAAPPAPPPAPASPPASTG